jgi:uncharacterized protein (DUF2252 family)
MIFDMHIREATARYEKWLAGEIRVIPGDLRIKHGRMKESPFAFLRATYYRWAQLWPELGEPLAGLPRLLGVGDLHAENFGTWRDPEGRLVWGINDFDEAARLSFPSDLVRLSVSALLPDKEHDSRLGRVHVLEAILGGYRDGIAMGGSPFVLEERHPELRRMAQRAPERVTRFWKDLLAMKEARGHKPKPAIALLRRLLPRGVGLGRTVHRIGGLGSLGRQRLATVTRDAVRSTVRSWIPRNRPRIPRRLRPAQPAGPSRSSVSTTTRGARRQRPNQNAAAPL